MHTHRIHALGSAVALVISGCAGNDDRARAHSSRSVTADTVIQAPVQQPAVKTSPDSAARGSVATGVEVRPAAAPTSAVPRGPRRVLLGDVDLTGVGHDQGSLTAPVVLIDFSDFGCPYCGQFTRETYPAIEREYVRTGKVFFKYVPFIVGMFPNAAEATRAAECAGDQGRFWAMSDQVYGAQKEWRRGGDPRALLTGLAGEAGADTVKFSQCYSDRRTDVRTQRATGVANSIGVRVTPSFIVNERPIEGALPLADFRKVIDAALLLKASRK